MSTLLPCVVTRDLNCHLANLDRRERQAARREAFTEERYEGLTEDAAGLAEVMEALYCYEGSAVDQAVFRLFDAWREGHDLNPAATALAYLIEGSARRMAAQWATQQAVRADEAAALDALPTGEW